MVELRNKEVKVPPCFKLSNVHFCRQESSTAAVVAHGDRGNVVVNVPAPVVPYVPTFMNRPDQVPDQFENIPTRSENKPPRSRKNPVRSRIGTSTQKTILQDSSTLSEDFDAFRSVTDRTTTESSKKRTNDLAYQETDRIDVPNLLLPGAMTSSDPLSNKVSVAVPSVSEPGQYFSIEDHLQRVFEPGSRPYKSVSVFLYFCYIVRCLFGSRIIKSPA